MRLAFQSRPTPISVKWIFLAAACWARRGNRGDRGHGLHVNIFDDDFGPAADADAAAAAGQGQKIVDATNLLRVIEMNADFLAARRELDCVRLLQLHGAGNDAQVTARRDISRGRDSDTCGRFAHDSRSCPCRGPAGPLRSRHRETSSPATPTRIAQRSRSASRARRWLPSLPWRRCRNRAPNAEQKAPLVRRQFGFALRQASTGKLFGKRLPALQVLGRLSRERGEKESRGREIDGSHGSVFAS